MTTLMEHPLSVGSVHAKSTDPADFAVIDPKVYSHPIGLCHSVSLWLQLIPLIDKALALAALKFAREKIATTDPLKSIISDIFWPPAGASDEVLAASLIQSVVTGHVIGTAALGAREEDGVVDPNLKVSDFRITVFIRRSRFTLGLWHQQSLRCTCSCYLSRYSADERPCADI